MTAFLSTSPFSQALGWTLLHFLWQGAIVALLLACVLGVLPSNARLRYAAGCAAMALMVILPLITFGILVAKSHQGTIHYVIPAASEGRSAVLTGDLAESTQPWIVRCEEAMNQWLPSLIGFWLAGVFVLLCRLNLGLIATMKLNSLTLEPAAVELQNALQSLRIRLGIDRTVRLLHSARVHAPTVIGWLRPAILIPVGCMAGLSELQVEAILAHELAHIRRRDYLISLFQSLVETMLFYHPAVWWVSNQVRREREHCCDDLAVAISADRLAYAKALTYLEERRGSMAVGAFAANGGVLKMRIARLLGVNPPPIFPRAAAITLLALAGTSAAVAFLAPASAHSASPTNETSGERGSVYQKWLNQDVRWIITPEEKNAFLRLSNDQERNAFVHQFWEHRNPTPGNPVNAYKQEHYQRVAYANMHFGVNGEPGWEADRGHVYIVFGQPDSIDSHPSGDNGSTKPFEVWHYRSVSIEMPALKDQNGPGYSARSEVRGDVDFRFIDDCACGRYQLRSPWPPATATQNGARTDFGGMPFAAVHTITSMTKKDSGPDLSCTYYDVHTRGFNGTCETRHGYERNYYCVNDNDKKLFQEQTGCEWKVSRARSLKQNVPEIQESASR